jgi:hypothetical protein
MSYTTLDLPNTRTFTPVRADFGLRPNVRLSTSPFTEGVKTVEIPGARWVATLTFAPQAGEERARVESFFASVRGQANRIRMGHPSRKRPRGTIGGSVFVQGDLPRGWLGATLYGLSPGATLLAGDLVGINGQLLMVTSDQVANGSGVMSIGFAPGLREPVSANTAVEWNNPKTTWILTDNEVRVPHAPGVSPSFSVDLMETWEI